jgi:hypothetical protein
LLFYIKRSVGYKKAHQATNKREKEQTAWFFFFLKAKKAIN